MILKYFKILFILLIFFISTKSTECCYAKDFYINCIQSLCLKKSSMGWPDRGGSSAIKLNDGRVLITGGLTTKHYVLIFPEDIPTNQSQIYDPKTKKISLGPNMLFNRSHHSSILLPDGRVFIYDGIYYENTEKTEFYNPDTNTFTPGPSLIFNKISTGLDADAWFIDDKKQYLCIISHRYINLYDLKNDKMYAIDTVHYDYCERKFTGTDTIVGFEDKALEKDLMNKMKKHPAFFALNNLKNNKPCKIVHYKDNLYYLFGEHIDSYERRNIFLYDANTKEKKVVYTKKFNEYAFSEFESCVKLQNNKVLLWGYDSNIKRDKYDHYVTYQVFDMDTKEIKMLGYRTRLPKEAPVLLDDGTIFWLNSGILYVSKIKEDFLD